MLAVRQASEDGAADCQAEAWNAFVAAAKAQGFAGDTVRELQGDLIHVPQSVDEACPQCGFSFAAP